MDDLTAHYSLEGNILAAKNSSRSAEYTISVLYLNRPHLTKLRDLRKDLHATTEAIVIGLRALRGIRLDALPQALRLRFWNTRASVLEQAKQARSLVDDAMIIELARSPYLDDDPNKERHLKNRRKYLKSLGSDIRTHFTRNKR